jgi:hypothetical protein
MRMELESTRGGSRRLEDERGRAVVVFYEAHGHTRDNEALKRACGRRMEQSGGLLRVIGVANLRGLGRVRPLVRAAVRRVAEHYGVELWMDFDGLLQRPPLSLGDESSVAVLAPGGEVLFRADGPLGDPSRFHAALEEALTRAARAA